MTIATPIPLPRPKSRSRRLQSAVAALALLVLGLPAAASSLQEVIDNEPRFSIFANALKESGVWQEFENRQATTVFVPTDEALRAAGSAPLLEGVLLSEANRQRLRDVMFHHVHFEQRLSPDGIEDVELVTENGACFLITRVGGGIRVGPTAVVTEHISTNDGSLFVIDRLLWRSWTGKDLCRGSSQ